jgi:hypothetical protein
MKVVFHIQVGAGRRAVVSQTPVVRLKKNRDAVLFTSNDPTTIIKYGDTTPFDVPELQPNTELLLELSEGPFPAVIPGEKHHFRCGSKVNNVFADWLGTDGADTPVDP